MKEKTSDYYYSIGCGTALLPFSHRIFYISIYMEQRTADTDRTGCSWYIIEHVDEFRDEINAMGYEVRAYTVGNARKKYNPADQDYKKAWISRTRNLNFRKGNEEYVFDVGFDVYRLCMDDGTIITMSKDYYYEDKV